MDIEPAESQRGRRRVRAAIGIFVGTSAVVIAQYLMTIGTDRLPAQIIRFFLTCTLSFFLYRGIRWAHWTIVGLLSVTVLGAALSGQYALPIVYTVVVWNLLRRDTRAFLEAQRLRTGQVPVVARS
jgi:multisubunit Na+/H+ antiporter MnhB subunit